MTRAARVVVGLMAPLMVYAIPTSAAPAFLSVTGRQEATRPPISQDRPMNDAPQGHALLPTARQAADHVLAFLVKLQSTADITVDNLKRSMGVTLGPDADNGPGWAVYRADIGQGWTYGVQHRDPRPDMKAGFSFWFYNHDRSADAAPVCALPLDRLKDTLKTSGWNERPVNSEIGSVLAIEFTKADMVLTLTPRDGATVGGTACVLSLQTTDGR